MLLMKLAVLRRVLGTSWSGVAPGDGWDWGLKSPCRGRGGTGDRGVHAPRFKHPLWTAGQF